MSATSYPLGNRDALVVEISPSNIMPQISAIRKTHLRLRRAICFCVIPKGSPYTVSLFFFFSRLIELLQYLSCVPVKFYYQSLFWRGENSSVGRLRNRGKKIRGKHSKQETEMWRSTRAVKIMTVITVINTSNAFYLYSIVWTLRYFTQSY